MVVLNAICFKAYMYTTGNSCIFASDYFMVHRGYNNENSVLTRGTLLNSYGNFIKTDDFTDCGYGKSSIIKGVSLGNYY